jgi:molecular chaperone GrpE (heat shock protein)
VSAHHEDKHVELVPDPPSGNPSPQVAGDTSEEYKKLLAEKQELVNTLLRRQADFENYRKRVEKERQQDRIRGVELFVEQILPVLDAFDLALDGRGEWRKSRSISTKFSVSLAMRPATRSSPLIARRP